MLPNSACFNLLRGSGAYVMVEDDPGPDRPGRTEKLVPLRGGDLPRARAGAAGCMCRPDHVMRAQQHTGGAQHSTRGWVRLQGQARSG